MKYIFYILTIFFIPNTILAQDSIVIQMPKLKEMQTPKSYLDSIKRTFVNHKAGDDIDKKWMQELLSNETFANMEKDISRAYLNENVDYDLPTDLLRTRLQNMKNKYAFDIEYNETLEKLIKSFLKKRSKSFERLMALSEYYFPMFEEYLAKYDVPLEIKYLAIVESALNPSAKSKAGATGLWQFMYGTGKQYNLDINTYVDERSDPLKSTEAAAKYLRDLYDVFGNWEMVLASYNAGPGTVTKAIRRANGETNYWKLRNYLPKETQGYVPAFIATMYIYEYHKEHGILPQRAAIPYIKTDTISLKKDFTFQELSHFLDISVEELKLMNPKYKLDKIPKYDGSNYSLRLPVDKIARFTSNEKKIYDYYNYITYYNQEMDRRRKLFITQEEIAKKAIAAKNKTQAEVLDDPKYQWYEVKSGDNLHKIATNFNMDLEEIKKINAMTDNTVHLGKKLKVSATNEKAKTVNLIPVTDTIPTTTPKIEIKKSIIASTKNTEKYVVKKGDTLYSISKQIGNITVDELMKINNMKSASDLKIGMTLKTKI